MFYADRFHLLNAQSRCLLRKKPGILRLIENTLRQIPGSEAARLPRRLYKARQIRLSQADKHIL